jgi:hypothetical protein
MAEKISEDRKRLYDTGLVMMIIGGCLFALPFLAIPIVMIGGIRAGGPPRMAVIVPIAFLGAFIGFGLIAAGGIMRSIAARGKAGSGLVLDPQQARKDLEPWSRMAGGVVKDALEEADIKPGETPNQEAQKVVMLQCTQCGKLNEADSKFCQECGRPM